MTDLEREARLTALLVVVAEAVAWMEPKEKAQIEAHLAGVQQDLKAVRWMIARPEEAR